MDFRKTILLLSAVIALASATTTYGDGTVQAEFGVKCSDTHFAVYFNYTAMKERTVGTYNNRSFEIHFKDDPSCRVPEFTQQSGDFHNSVSAAGMFSDSTYIGTEFSTSMCGINYYSDQDYIIYNTTVVVTYGQDPSATVLRAETDNYHVSCLRNRTVDETLNGEKFDVDKRLTGNQDKNTTAVFDLTLDHADMKGTKQTVYKMGDFIKFTLTLNSIRTVKAVIQGCWAGTGSEKAALANRYDLITNKCKMEQLTYWTAAATNTVSEFKTEAFRFSTQKEVYVECSIRVCLSDDATAECTFCHYNPAVSRKRRAIGDAGQEKSQTAIVKSPVFYIIESDRQQAGASSSSDSSSVLSGTNGLIVIILVSAFVFVICAAVIKKVFFTAPVVADAPVIAYSNKAMA